MSKRRFVVPETVRLELSDGDWIEVKERLTYGEEQRLAGSGLSGIRAVLTGDNEEVDYDFGRQKIARLAMWIVEWSFVDGDDRRVPAITENIEKLDPATAREIDRALTEHIELIQAERDEETAEALIKRYEEQIAGLRERKNS